MNEIIRMHKVYDSTISIIVCIKFMIFFLQTNLETCKINRFEIDQSQSNVNRIVDCDWFILYGLRLITIYCRLKFML